MEHRTRGQVWVVFSIRAIRVPVAFVPESLGDSPWPESGWVQAMQFRLIHSSTDPAAQVRGRSPAPSSDHHGHTEGSRGGAVANAEDSDPHHQVPPDSE